MNFFTQNTLRTVYFKPSNRKNPKYIQAVKVSKETYWVAANMLLANPAAIDHGFFYTAIQSDAIIANRSVARSAEILFNELTYDDALREREADFLVAPPELTNKRKREIALHQQVLASEYAMQGYEKLFPLRKFDVLKYRSQENDIHN
jgi:hypothetical protein